MTTMIERVARAICEADVKWYVERFPSVPAETIRQTAEGDLVTNYSALARAAIEEMRVPTEAMSDSLDTHELHAGWLYTKAIDTALLEHQP